MAQNTLFERINIRGYVDGWARVTIELWKKQLRKKRIGITKELENSFQKELKLKGTELAEVVIKFKMYGRFLDMGVGKGISANERGSNRQNRNASRAYGARVSFSSRRDKRWLNKIKTAQSYRLSELLAQRSSETVIQDFNNTNNVTVQING